MSEVANELLKLRHLQGGAVMAIVQKHMKRTTMNLEEHAERGNVAAALSVLDRVPDADPDVGDELANGAIG